MRPVPADKRPVKKWRQLNNDTHSAVSFWLVAVGDGFAVAEIQSEAREGGIASHQRRPADRAPRSREETHRDHPAVGRGRQPRRPGRQVERIQDVEVEVDTAFNIEESTAGGGRPDNGEMKVEPKFDILATTCVSALSGRIVNPGDVLARARSAASAASRTSSEEPGFDQLCEQPARWVSENGAATGAISGLAGEKGSDPMADLDQTRWSPCMASRRDDRPTEKLPRQFSLEAEGGRPPSSRARRSTRWISVITVSRQRPRTAHHKPQSQEIRP